MIRFLPHTPIPRCPCGAPAVCVDPGELPTIHFDTDITLLPGRAVTGVCWACAPRRRVA